MRSTGKRTGRTGRRLTKHVGVTRGGRAAGIHWEWYSDPEVPYSYLMVGIADPHVHRNWATTVYLYLPPLASRVLGRIPSTGWRSWGDTWAPLRPWAGKSRPWSRKGKRS